MTTATKKPYPMMFLHRTFGIVTVIVLLFIALTGTSIQVADLRAILSHEPANDPDIQDLQAHGNGPPNYAVLSIPDYTAPALPAQLDYQVSFARLAELAHAAAPAAPVRLIELRTAEGKTAGHVQVGAQHLIFDMASGAPLSATDLPPANPALIVPSAREAFKSMHRFRFFSTLAVAINPIAALVFGLLAFTGLVHYFRLLASRRKAGRDALLWRAGGWWRDLHRWFSVVAAIFVIVLTLSGLGLSINCLGQELYIRSHLTAAGAMPRAPTQPTSAPLVVSAPAVHSRFTGLYNWTHRPSPGVTPVDQTSPLKDSELAGMTRTTLNAYSLALPGTGIRVLRLRYFAGYPQGVVVSAGPQAKQFVFNAITGRPMGETEPGYPSTGFPFGWAGHQWLKAIHSGEMFGMPGRMFETLGGLAMVYLAFSGIIMYYPMWARRRQGGRQGLFWR
jgi:uncharacterized iron-regulated membrane protein